MLPPFLFSATLLEGLLTSAALLMLLFVWGLVELQTPQAKVMLRWAGNAF